MKKIIILVFTVLLVSLVACSKKETNNEKDLLAVIKERGTLIVATEGDWSPYTYHDEKTNELVGFDVEFAKMIADKLGVSIEYKETDWDSILAGVQSGTFDLGINGITYSEKRAESFNFSIPYLYDETVLIVLEDNEDIKSFEDLKGKINTNSPGSSYAQMGEEYGATTKYVTTFADTIQLLQRGDADCTINSLSVYNEYIKEKGDNAGIKVVAKTEPEKTVVASCKGDYSKTLIDEVNKIIEELRSDGSLAELSNKYFGYDATKVSE